jgi:hypothetical protein
VLRTGGAGNEEVGPGGQQGWSHIACMPGTQDQIDAYVADLAVAIDPPAPESH